MLEQIITPKAFNVNKELLRSGISLGILKIGVI